MNPLNLIIIEDEPAILKGIVMLIRRIDLPLVITGAYSNGREALEDLEQSCPDIVMTDVQMPVMSGLQLVEKMKELGYASKYIILSGYAEFEYARTAIRLGVNHYLLKSPRISELKEALSSLCDEIYETRYSEYRRYLQKLLLRQSRPSADSSQFPELRLRFYLYAFGPLLEHLPEDVDSCNNYIDADETLALITKRFPQSRGYIWILNGYTPGTKIILESDSAGQFLSPGCLYELLKEQAAKELAALEQAVKEQAVREQLPVTLICLPGTETFPHLHDALLYAMKYLQRKIRFGESRLYTVPSGQSFSVTETLSKTERDMLCEALNSHRTDLFVKHYLYFARDWRKRGYSQAECTALTRQCLSEICRSLPAEEAVGLEETALSELFRITASARTFENFFDKCSKLMENILNSSGHFPEDSQVDDVVELLYRHILTDYGSKIDINGFAREHGYHPIYLITRFTRLKAISPTKLIIQLRLNQAKEMLAHTDMRLKDIADAVGYYDVSYFSRVFKEREGVSPGSYRKETSSTQTDLQYPYRTE